MLVYLKYTRAQLDAEYNNSAKVSDADAIIDWYCATSRIYSKQTTGKSDLRYGATPAESLDLYFPDGRYGATNALRPLQVFFHGGYWQAMHKEDFSYIANAFSGTNAIVAVVNYALIPDVNMAELVEQCRRSIIWLYQNIETFGGNPDSITVSGHSAGGHLVAMMMATDWPSLDSGCPSSLVKAGVSLSGLFDLEPIRLSYLNDILALSEEDVEHFSPVKLRNENTAKLVCLYGDQEGAEYRRQSETLTALWQNTSAKAVVGHNHFSIAKELHNPDSAVALELRKQLTLA